MRVKICCIANVTEARLAIAHGVHALGLVAHMPSGPGVIAEGEIATIARRIPPGATSVLLTSRRDAAGIIAQQRRCGVSAIQLCDSLDAAAHAALREALPGIALIQVVHVTGPEAVTEARRVAASADAILLDSGRPDLAVKELGGTGRAHDWAISREIVEAVEAPVFLAGGLDADNVAAAIRAVRPYAVDVCTGVRTDGQLDAAKLARFVSASTDAW